MKNTTHIKITFLFYVILSASLIKAQNWSWAKSFNGSTIDYASKICSDPQGNVYFTGDYSSNTFTVGNITLQNNSLNGGNDIFIGKANSNGNIIWAKSFGSSITEWGNDIICDAQGNVYLCGIYGSDSVDFGNQIKVVNSNPGSNNYFVVKLNSNGDAIWARTAICETSCEATVVSVDNIGNVYVSGLLGALSTGFNGSLTSDTLVHDNSNPNNSFLVKFDSSGVFKYVKRVAGSLFGSSGIGGPKGMSIDNNNNIYMTGILYDINANDHDKEIFVSKYNSKGEVVWIETFGSTEKDIVENLTIDNNGNIYLAGYYESPSLSIGSYTLSGSISKNSNRFAFKLNNDGTVLWAKKLTNATGNLLYDLTVDGSGNIYLCGTGIDSTMFGNPFSYPDLIVMKLNTQGAVQWTMKAGDGFAGGGFEVAKSICLDPSGNIYVLGQGTGSTLYFDNISIITNQSIDVFLAKISTGGNINIGSLYNSNNLVYLKDGKDLIIENDAKGKYMNMYSIDGKLILNTIITEGYNLINMSHLKGVYVVQILNSDSHIQQSVKINLY